MQIRELTALEIGLNQIGHEHKFPFLNAIEKGARGDSGVDNTAALQAAIDAANGGTVIVPAGVHLVSRVNPGTTDYCLNLSGAMNLMLATGAVIKLADGEITNGTDEVYMLNISASDVSITGFGKIDMNRAGQTDTTIGTNISTRICINQTGAHDNTRVENITVQDAMGAGVRIKGANNTTGVALNSSVQNIRMFNCREGVAHHWVDNIKCNFNYLIMDNSTGAQDGLELSECGNAHFIGNYVEGALGSGLDLYENGGSCIVANNTVYNCGYGYNIGYTPVVTQGTEFIVANNVADTITTGSGMTIYSDAGVHTIIVQANILRNITTVHGIDVLRGSNVSLLDNKIDGVTIGNAVYIRAGVDGSTVRGTEALNIGGIGIRIAADNCKVQTNTLTTITGDGIDIAGTGNVLDGNIMPGEQIDDNGTSTIATNNVVSALDIAGATTPIHHNNVIAGVWTA